MVVGLWRPRFFQCPFSVCQDHDSRGPRFWAGERGRGILDSRCVFCQLCVARIDPSRDQFHLHLHHIAHCAPSHSPISKVLLPLLSLRACLCIIVSSSHKFGLSLPCSLSQLDRVVDSLTRPICRSCLNYGLYLDTQIPGLLTTTCRNEYRPADPAASKVPVSSDTLFEALYLAHSVAIIDECTRCIVR